MPSDGARHAARRSSDDGRGRPSRETEERRVVYETSQTEERRCGRESGKKTDEGTRRRLPTLVFTMLYSKTKRKKSAQQHRSCQESRLRLRNVGGGGRWMGDRGESNPGTHCTISNVRARPWTAPTLMDA